MEYTTEDIYWEDAAEWYKSQSKGLNYYFHNNEVSSWKVDKKIWSGDYDNYKKKMFGLVWKKTDSRFIRDCVKIHHGKEEWKGQAEFPYLSDGYDFGNQATKYQSVLGKGDKRRFTMLLDDDLYEDVVEEAQGKGIRRNTYLNAMIRTVYENPGVEMEAK